MKFFIASFLVVILLSSSFALSFADTHTGKKIASFVDLTKDPQSYVTRYQNEPIYKTWFDKNYGSTYKSIYEAVGLPEPKITSEPKTPYVQLYKDKDYGFALDLFKKWEADESQSTLLTLFYTGTTSGAIIPMVSLNYIQMESGSIKPSCDDYLSQFSSTDTQQRIIKCTSNTINDGTKTTIKLLEKNFIDGKYYKERRDVVYYDKNNGDFYTMIFQSDVKDYRQVIKDFNNLDKSFMTFAVSYD